MDRSKKKIENHALMVCDIRGQKGIGKEQEETERATYQK